MDEIFWLITISILNSHRIVLKIREDQKKGIKYNFLTGYFFLLKKILCICVCICMCVYIHLHVHVDGRFFLKGNCEFYCFDFK